MSGKVRSFKLSPLAEVDLEEIWLYTFQTWSLEQADAYHSDIVAAFEGLAVGTKVGRPVDLRDGYFKYAVGSHLVFNRQSDFNLDIIRILHQRMDTSAHL